MGLNWAEHTVEINAPIDTCFAAIIDYETFPSWQGAVVDTEVLDWDTKGRGKKVRLFVDAKVRKVDYTLDYSYEEPTRIEWDFVEGNGINGADGHYLFEDLGNERTRATYKLGLEVGIPLPGPVARRAHKTTLKGSVEDLKREAERRASSARKATNGSRSEEKTREDALAEKVGIRQPPPPPPPVPADDPEDWAPPREGSIIELPVKVAGRAAGLGMGVARRTIGAGLGVAGALTDRAARLAGRRPR
jgi:polyketide cyclase/dehydrase/lipid transport protein